MKKILGCIRKADEDFHLIEDGDRVAIGVSGGKDSVLLLYALQLYRRFAPASFDVIAIHVDIGFPGMDFQPLDEFCLKQGIPIVHVPTVIYDVLKQHKNHHDQIPCSLCSRMKKAAMIAAAKEHHATKVAYAHHGDDAVETLFLNMIYAGRIETFKPKMYMDRTDTIFIRPLYYAREADIIHAVKEAGLPVVPSTCPVDKKTKREEIKQRLAELYRAYPQAVSNFQLMLERMNKHENSI